MTMEKHAQETETLGQFLKKIRISQGYDLEQIVEQTRISASNLKAMETDNYAALPADAFSRGFYTIYARLLRLDPDEIVTRYRRERGLNPRKDGVVAHNPPAHKAAQQVSNMAEPSFFSPVSTIGYVLLLLIILSGGICWYLDINPATFISEKLRSLQIDETSGGAGDLNDGDSGQPASPENNDQGSIRTFSGKTAPVFFSLNGASFPAEPRSAAKVSVRPDIPRS